MPAKGHVTDVFMQWKDIVSLPSGWDLEVAVIDKAGVHAIAFPCRYRDGVWINANTRKAIEISPTHWREWKAGRLSGSANTSSGPSTVLK
jgi:hypothetical protein